MVSNIKSFITRLMHRGDEALNPDSSEHPKAKTSATTSDLLPTASLEAHHTTERSESPRDLDDSTSRLPTPHDSPPVNRGQVAARLPKLTIPIFGGDPLDWQPFWDSYEAAIHSNTQLNGAQKLSYLRAQLRGDAAQAIAGLSLTSASYEHSIEVLKKRFGQNHIFVSSHMQALIDLSSPTNTLEGLRRFHDLIESHIRSLTTLGKSTDTYSAMLVPFLLRKLPVDTIRNLAREHETSDWTLEELQEALLKEIRIFETSLHTLTSHRANNFGQTSSLPTASFHTNVNAATNSPTHRPSCNYCKSSTHASTNCDKVDTQQARVEFIKQHNLCFNCLGHHRASRCNSKKRCRQCKRKHHTSICTEAPSSDNNSPPSNSSNPPSGNSSNPPPGNNSNPP